MVKIEVMDSTPPNRPAIQRPWHNRRVQRSALVCFIILTLVVLGFYTRHSWPDVADIHLDTLGGLTSYTSTPEAGVPVGPSSDSKEGSSFYTADAKPGLVKSGGAPKGPVALDPTRVALIIETRPIPHLPALLTAFIGTVPPQWIVKVVGLDSVFDFIHSSASLIHHVNTGKLVLQKIPPNYPTTDNEALSQTLTNRSFYGEFLAPAEWILMFQTDSMICSASAQTLDDWVEKDYDWVGAPWHIEVPGGNGGLSLRHIPSILKVLEKEERKPHDEQWEDLWLCQRLPNPAPAPIEVEFSVESIYAERPLGYHLRGSGKLLDPSIWGNRTRKRQVLTYCPEMKIVLGNMGLEDAHEDEYRNEDEGEKLTGWRKT
ncbi:MAG: hypothetical protein M1818_004867 [Claussenomyces sp. TS43310]|nr:MAG: hypothetical protein M1818_004867 [Claussenomyces sp. TS43310]